MFTGLIEAVGEVVEVRPVESGFGIRVRSDLAAEIRKGESVAVNGVCLTAVAVHPGELHAEIGPETARVTSLGTLSPGSFVNLERAMRADARFGGHFVLGHVDGVGTIQRIRPDADFWWVGVSFPPALAPYLIHRGSIAVDGISLTIASLGGAATLGCPDRSSFDVQIVPYTWTHTNLKDARVGDVVNLETDMVGKYVVRAVELMGKLTV
jgi:riboflavin synthase